MGVTFKKNTLYAVTFGIGQQRLTEFPTYAFPLCFRSYSHLRQLMAVSFRMGF